MKPGQPLQSAAVWLISVGFGAAAFGIAMQSSSAFLAALVCGLLASGVVTPIVIALSRRFAWRRPGADIVGGALSGLGAVALLLAFFFIAQNDEMVAHPPASAAGWLLKRTLLAAAAGASAGLVYWAVAMRLNSTQAKRG